MHDFDQHSWKRITLKRYIKYDITYRNYIILNPADIERSEQPIGVIINICLPGSAHRIAFSPLVTRNRYFRSDYPLPCLIAGKLPRRIAKLPAATSNLRETSVIICSLAIFPGALPSSRKKKESNVAAGLRKSRESRIAHGKRDESRCGTLPRGL